MRIGEVAAAAGLPSRTLRFYEDRGLLTEPERSANGYRNYGKGIAARLEFIAAAGPQGSP